MFPRHVGPIPKPQSRAAEKKAKARRARNVVKSVRQQCVDRDGRCRLTQGLSVDRLFSNRISTCDGVSEWAHLGNQKRFKTRGQPPERRHTTAGSLMLCTRHHQDYDQGRLLIEGDDANGILRFRLKG